MTGEAGVGIRVLRQLTVSVEYGTTGALWQQPLSILSARLVKFGLQMYF